MNKLYTPPPVRTAARSPPLGECFPLLYQTVSPKMSHVNAFEETTEPRMGGKKELMNTFFFYRVKTENTAIF